MFKRNLSLKFTLMLVFISLGYPKSAHSQRLDMFDKNPLQYDDNRFTFLVFPFNSAFMKSKKVKRLYYIVGKRTQNKCYYEFDKNGELIKRYWIKTNEKKEEQTELLEERIYNKNKTGQLDTLFEFNDLRGSTDVHCYHYDQQNRVTNIFNFKIIEIPEPGEKEGQAGELEKALNNTGIPIDPDEPQEEWIDKYGKRGRPRDKDAFLKMKRQYDFNSERYRYYKEGQFDVVEETEQYDFSKKYGKTDTCHYKHYYYKQGNKVIKRMNSPENCKNDPYLSNTYFYSGMQLDSIQKNYRGVDVFVYDSMQNLIGLNSYEKRGGGSEIKMFYDENNLLIKLIGRENVLFFDYEFY